MAKRGSKATGSSSTSPELSLSKVERELLVRALQKHRRTIPFYLQSSQEELQRIDKLVDKLSG